MSNFLGFVKTSLYSVVTRIFIAHYIFFLFFILKIKIRSNYSSRFSYLKPMFPHYAYSLLDKLGHTGKQEFSIRKGCILLLSSCINISLNGSHQ